MPDIFLSYSREDQATARRCAEVLTRAGFSVWWDQTLNAGEHYDKVTEQALRTAKAVVVLWSKHSVESRWVRAEATIADRNGTLVPAMIEPCDRPVMFELTQTAELAHWKGDVGDPAWQSFLASVKRMTGHGPADGVSASVPAAALPAAHSAKRSRARAMAIGLAVLAVAGGLTMYLIRGDQPATAAAATPTDPITIAVRPFETLSTDADLADWSLGLADDLATELNGLKALRVYGPQSTAPGTSGPKVAHEVVARVSREGPQLKVTVRLLDGDGAYLWTEDYQSQEQDVFTLRHRIATDVAQAVGVLLDATGLPRAEGGTIDYEAWRLVRGAVAAADEGGNNTQATMKAIQSLRAAVKRDAGYTNAWMLLSIYLGNAVAVAPPDALPGLQQELDEAYAQLDASPRDHWLAKQHRANRLWRQTPRQWLEVVAAAEEAAAATPANFAGGNAIAAYVLQDVGRIREAIAYQRRVVETAPRSVTFSRLLVALLRGAGRNVEADQEQARLREATGGAIVPGTSPAGDPKSLLPRRADGRLDWPLAGELPSILDDPPALRVALRRSLEAAGSRNEPGLILFLAEQFARDPDLVRAALLRSFARITQSPGFGFGQMVWLNPAFPRDLPEVKPLLREAGLVDYWSKSGKWSDFCHQKGDDDFECFDKPVISGPN